jgi:leucine dehydrogenase
VDDTSVFEHGEYHGHPQVMFFSDAASGLRAIIAIHRLRGGRSGGGIRFYPYASGAAALTDVLRLSRAMTDKMVLCEVPVGGGKSVILGDPKTEKSPELLRAFGKIVDGLDGRYICAPDVGTRRSRHYGQASSAAAPTTSSPRRATPSCSKTAASCSHRTT